MVVGDSDSPRSIRGGWTSQALLPMSLTAGSGVAVGSGEGLYPPPETDAAVAGQSSAMPSLCFMAEPGAAKGVSAASRSRRRSTGEWSSEQEADGGASPRGMAAFTFEAEQGVRVGPRSL